MGHYDDQRDEDYARQRAEQAEKDRIRRQKIIANTREVLEKVKDAHMHLASSRQIIYDQLEILEALLEKEINRGP